MRKDQVNPNKVGIAPNTPIPALFFSGTFDNHLVSGDKKGTSHSGLHLISGFRKDAGGALTAADIVANESYTGRLDDRATTVTIKSVDLRAKTFVADVNIYGTAKESTFFPVGATLDAAKGYIKAAWKDACTYGSAAYGGGDVEVYKQMRSAFGLNWVGMATISSQEIRIGCAHSGSVDTTFPAVNNKFS
jgi:hypothetical protein